MSEYTELPREKWQPRADFAGLDPLPLPELGNSFVADGWSHPKDLSAFRATLPKRLRVTLATPCDDGHRLCFWDSLVKTLERGDMGCDLRVWTPPGDSLVTRGRDNITHDFYFNSSDDYLGFIDSDIDFRPEDVVQGVERRLPIVAGHYAIKQQDLRWCLNSIDGEKPDGVTGLYRVATAGTGWLFFHRSVVARMIAAERRWKHWRMRYIDDARMDVRYHLFADEVIDDPVEFTHSPRRMSEDWSFCYFARKLGYDIWADDGIIVMHEGSIKYPLQAHRESHPKK